MKYNVYAEQMHPGKPKLVASGLSTPTEINDAIRFYIQNHLPFVTEDVLQTMEDRNLNEYFWYIPEMMSLDFRIERVVE